MAAPMTHGTPALARSAARKAATRLAAIAAPAAMLWAAAAALFVVDVTQYGVVTRFGEILRVIATPGLYLKAPFDNVVALDKRLLYTSPASAEYLTADKKNVVVRSLATWRISEPRRFLESLRTRERADNRLGDIILGEIGAVLGRHPFADLIADGDGPSRFAETVADIRERVRRIAAEAYGLEILDVDIRQLSLPDQNKVNVFERMTAERGRIAKRYRSEGQLESTKIIAAADRESTEILAEAYEEAQRIRAQGEAESMRIYAAAFSQNPAFYKFLRTLQAYELFLDDSTTLFLPADAEVFRILRQEGGPLETELDIPLGARGETVSAEESGGLFGSGAERGQGDGPE